MSNKEKLVGIVKKFLITFIFLFHSQRNKTFYGSKYFNQGR
ncbi:hypothetical protein LEP1GSC008_4601 [Leptospira kirschneri serovar Bulgarica str. Nikolaevo]|uniref:Uncharacterized protein n=1 Tax=Leptospira kirschneri serovar Bulgarica str. Nikolaevo TaxID=1240687 RepID=M6FIU8_9LEPT|nr:hypothetical protein LEP1GSC008_4601 [Leptospira kirschneri serovar Bulgarica str. Nikolaevo]